MQLCDQRHAGKRTTADDQGDEEAQKQSNSESASPRHAGEDQSGCQRPDERHPCDGSVLRKGAGPDQRSTDSDEDAHDGPRSVGGIGILGGEALDMR
jgi:hypothetical protein